MLKFAVQVSLVLLGAFVLATQAVTPPTASVQCGGGEVRFIANATQNNVTYGVVNVVGQADVAGCFKKNTTDDQFVLTFKPADCNVTVAADGMASFQIRIAESSLFTTIYDGLVNVTCNVTGMGSHMTNQTLPPVMVDTDINTVKAKYPKLPPTKLVAKDKDGNVITQINMGAKFQVCLEFETVTSSPFKGTVVRECTLDGVAFTTKDGCNIKLSHGFPGYGFTHANGTSCTTIVAYRSPKSLQAKEVKIVCDVEHTLATSTQDGMSDCPAKRRRRDVNDHLMGKVELVLGVNNDQAKESPRQPVSNVCDGYTSNTVFFATVAILACLLLVSIGVAVFFGARARAIHVTSGKDNPAF